MADAGRRRAVRGPAGERGAATLEYVGLVVVLAVVVGAFVVTVPAQGLAERASCSVRSLVTQAAGPCDHDVPPVTFEADGRGEGDGEGSEEGSGAGDGRGDGVSDPAPAGTGDGDDGASGDEGSDDGDETGGDTGEDTGGDGGTDPTDVDQDTVDEALDDVQDALEGGLLGVRSGHLEDIEDVLEGLSGAELDAVVAAMSDDELSRLFDELEDGTLGSGWSRERRRELLSMIAAKASAETMERLTELTDEVQPDFGEVGGDDAADDPDSPAANAVYGDLEQELFLDGDDGTGVHPNDLEQGAIGDCWLIASMAAVAQQRPDLIEDMIRANPNGTYTVTFYDDGDPVEVTITPDFPLVDGEPVFARESSVDPDREGDAMEVWPFVLEKAAAQYYGDYTELEGDWPSKGLELLTGSSTTTHDDGFGFWDDMDVPSVESLESSFDSGAAILVSTPRENRTSLFDDGVIVQGHAYYVSDVDADTGTVTIRNPWGYKYDDIELTYEEFESSFIRYDVNPLIPGGR